MRRFEPLRILEPLKVPRKLGDFSVWLMIIENRDFSTLSSPLSDLLQKNKRFSMTNDALKPLDLLKESLCSAPVLVHPDYTKPFLIQCDASSTGIGAVLCQLDNEGSERPIYYYSKKLNKAQRN